MYLVVVVFYILIFPSVDCRNDEVRTRRRDVSAGAAQTCTCLGLTCTCCVSLDPQIFDPSTGCLKATYSPNELQLNLDIDVNGRNVYSTKIDSGNFPICSPVFPPACYAFNHIHIGNDGAEFCSEIRFGPIPILKLPCLTFDGNNLIATQNIY